MLVDSHGACVRAYLKSSGTLSSRRPMQRMWKARLHVSQQSRSPGFSHFWIVVVGWGAAGGEGVVK